VISGNYCQKPNTNLSPKECPEYECEFSFSFFEINELLGDLCGLVVVLGSR
jgi:hypothetical protein